MFLVTNMAKNTQVVVIAKKEIHFVPHHPIELDSLSDSERKFLLSVPMNVVEFDVGPMVLPANENAVMSVVGEKPDVADGPVVLKDSVAVLDEVKITVDKQEVQVKDVVPAFSLGTTGTGSIKAFGRKKVK
jgi:hypothetical protein